MATATGPILTYTGQKNSKIRWLPRQPGDLEDSSIFATGSYDNKQNTVILWDYSPVEHQNPDETIEDLSPSMTEPRPLFSVSVGGSVMDMEFIDRDKLVVCLSDGSLQMMNYYAGMSRLEATVRMDSLHCSIGGRGCPCTCVAVNQFSVFTGGEDGRVCIVSSDYGNLVSRIGEDDTTTVNALVCISQSELLAANSSGQLKLWDLREKPVRSSRTIVLSKDLSSALCLDRHPNQPHLIAAGCDNGSVCFWDLRQETLPMNILEAHSGEVWEARFHPNQPNYLFSCSQDGTLLQWNAASSSSVYPETLFNSSSATAGRVGTTSNTTHQNAWLMSPSSGLDVSNVLPGDNLSVNSFDICYKHLLAVTDQEALFIKPNQLL